MKKILLLTMLVILLTMTLAYGNSEIMTVPLYEGEEIDLETITEFKGMEKYYQKIQIGNFSDTKDPSVMRLAIQGIVNGYDDRNFYPDNNVNNIEMIIMLIRALGTEDEVIANVDALGLDPNAYGYRSILLDEFYDQAVASGILLGNEAFSYNDEAIREDMIIWVARALNLEAEPTYELVQSLDDFRYIEQVNWGLVEAALNEKIFTAENNMIYPDRVVTRGEFSNIVDSLDDRFLESRGLTKNFGVIMGTSDVDSISDTLINENTKDIIIKTINNGFVSIKMTNSSVLPDTGVAVLKDSRIVSHDSLEVNDQVSYITDADGVVTFVEVYENNAVISKITENLNLNDNVKSKIGYVKSILSLDDFSSDVSKSRVRVVGLDGAMYDLIVKKDYNGVDKDILMISNSGPIKLSDLNTDDEVMFYVSNNTELIMIDKRDVVYKEVTGTLKSVNKTDTGVYQLEVYDYNNEIKSYLVINYPEVIINFRNASIDDLKEGQPVKVTVSNGVVNKVISESYISNPGYIEENSRIVLGVIDYINGNKIYMINDENNPYLIDAATEIYKNDMTVIPSVLKAGDNIKIFMSSIYSNNISRLEIEGAEQLIEGVYKATLTNVNNIDDKITLRNIYTLENAEWKPLSSTSGKSVKLNFDTKILSGDETIDPQKLKSNFINSTVYIVTKDNYGIELAKKIVTKPSVERVYNDQVAAIDYFLNKMELDGRANVVFNNDTIFMKDDRLVTELSLSKDDNVLVVGSYLNGETVANLVNIIPNQDTIFDYIYAGALEVVNSYTLTLENYTKINGHEWDEVEDSQIKMYYNDDTYIVDYTPETSEVIERYDFFHGSYSREENKDEDDDGLDYERYYGFFVMDPRVADSREILAMSLRKEELLLNDNIDDEISKERYIDTEIEEDLRRILITKGTVADFDYDWNRAKIVNSSDWLNHGNEWGVNTTDLYIEMSETIIIKNNQVIQFEDLRAGDKLNLIREDEDAIIVIVEQ